ncbi:MAG: hypothetical protein SV186_02955 [Candidatus Nanohaloarchaea archaeon]|nr:hypothetical protein [Candidatus Nanohaloarchaea archaeon]
MRIKHSDAEEYIPDRTTELKKYVNPAASFSFTLIDVDGTHEVDGGHETAYFVLEGEGHVHLADRIVELDAEDVVFAGEEAHELEGEMTLLAIRSPPVDAD